MLSDELEDSSVSLSARRFRPAVTNNATRFAALLYTPEGKDLTDKVWAETMKELSFVGIEGILGAMRA